MLNILKNVAYRAQSLKPLFLVLASFAGLMQNAHGQLLYSDNFSRATNPAPITPWLIPASEPGTWEINNGLMLGEAPSPNNYTFAYITNIFTNYSVQARIAFSTSNAWGGGIGGYLNTNTGAHYAAWLYPENSDGGGPAVRLVKFNSWTSFEYGGTNFAFMAVTNLSGLSVGTNTHILRLALSSNQTIQVFLDGNQVINTTDIEAGIYTNGATSFDLFQDTVSYVLSAADFEVAVQSTTPLAVNDSYNGTSGETLTVGAPGVLINDTDGQGPLTAVLATTTSHGTLNLNSNGSFTYTPNGGFSGTDSFTYEAYDGHSDSAAATVTLTIAADVPPLANNVSYELEANATLAVAAPGILATDTDSDNQPLTAILVTGPTNGVLSFTNNGSFSYTPSNNFSGTDTFTYEANDGISNSTPATVTLTVLPATTLFFDNFANNTVAPWVVETGNWSAASGALVSSLNTADSYAFAYLTNIWTNYSVQGQVSFATNSFGGGLGGRLTSSSGTHYGAWVYPEGSPGGGPALRVVKFSSYSSFGYGGTNGVFMAATNLTAVGTGLHTLKLGLYGTQIAVYFDGTQMISVTDTDATTYPSGGVSADVFAASTSDSYSLQNVVVNDLVNNGFYSVPGGNTLTVSAPGVLTNSTPVFTTSLTASVVANPANGSLTLNANGSFTYTPNFGFSGQDSFTYEATDGSTVIGTATVYIDVVGTAGPGLVFSQNFDGVTAPALPSGWTTSATGFESNWTTTTVSNNTSPNSAFVPDVTNIGLSHLVSPTISLPAGPNQLTFKNNYNLEMNPSVTNDGYDTAVLEISIGGGGFTNIITAGGAFLAGGYNAVADTNFGNPLAGMAAWSGNSGGFITTTVDLPASASGQNIQLRWSCGTDNGNAYVGWWIDTISISNCPSAECWNTPPTLSAQTNVTVNELTLMTVTNTATSPGIPTNTVTYSLLTAPTNAAISTNGVITWTPSQTQSPSTNTFTMKAINNGTPALASTNTFLVFVREVNVAPVLPAQTNITNAGLATLTVTNTATNSNIHATNTGYNLASSPTGMTVSTNGIITWTPTVSQVPSTNTVTAVVTNHDSFDTNNPFLTATNTFTVYVTTVHNGPSLPAQANRTNNELVPLTVTNTATDTDVPVLSLTYYLTNTTPTNASISTNGIITWTPAQTQSPGTNTITTVVLDSGTPAKSATNSFTVVVKEVNQPPTLPTITNQTVNELTLLTVADTATNSNIHATNTTYTLSNALSGMSITTNGVFSWTPAQTQSPGTDTVTVIVANTNAFDTNNPVLKATNNFTVVVKEVNEAPSLPTIVTQTVNELTLLTVTNTATNSNIHAVITGYSLIGASNGMSISTNGIFTWTPAQTQSPSTNLVTVVATNNDVYDTNNPVLTATNSFTVIVKEKNIAPTPPTIGLQTVAELTLLTVTNAATETDIHATTTGYGLISALAGMNINSNGVFTWTPAQTQSPGTNTVTVVVTNNDPYDTVNSNLTATNTFTVVVKEVNQAPVLPVIGTQTVSELTLLTVTNSATEPNIHALTTGYSIVGPLTGMSINSNGIFTWTPSVNQSPSTNLVTVIVTNDDVYDTVNPVLTATNSFTVIVKESNIPPSLPTIPTQTVNELALLTVTNTATNADPHAVITGYALINSLAGMSISTNGIFTWTPAQTQSPGTNTVTTVVTNSDSFDTNNPVLTATNSFTVIVKEVNIAPLFSSVSTQTVTEQSLLTVTNTVTEPNIHALTTGYSILSPLTGMNIDTNGIFTWTPTPAQADGTNTVSVVATNYDAFDTVNPILTATNTFTVVVKDINIAPTLPTNSPQTVNELTLLVVTNTAAETDAHAVTIGYGLISPLAGMSISTNGIFTWTPAQTQSPGTDTVTVVVTNNDPYDPVNPMLTATNNFTVMVREVNVAPVLPTIGTQNVNEQILLTVNDTATEPNIHAATTGYALLGAVSGMSISTNGIFTWTPTQNQSPSTNMVTVVVGNNDPYDTNNPVLTSFNSFTIVVKEVNIAPTMPVVPTQTVNELTLLTVTNTATEANIHAVITGYGIINPLPGMSVDTNGIFTWTPSQSESGGTNLVSVVASNYDSYDTINPVLVTTNTFNVIVKEINVAPVLPTIQQQSVAELNLLTVTNTAIESNIHATTISYTIVSPLAGMGISTNGIFTWTPAQTQSPSTNLVSVIVTNNDPYDQVNPNLSATNSFTVVVVESNMAPVMPVVGTQTVSEQTLITVTNTATEPNIHAVTTGYMLVSPLPGMNLNTNGIFTWTPTQSQSPSTNTVTVIATNYDSLDAVKPVLTATNIFTVVVREINIAPVLPVIGTQTINELTLLTVTNTATEANIHAVITGYGIMSPLAGMSISTNGIFTWTPSQNESPGTNTVSVVVTNNDPSDSVNPVLTATNSFTVIVKEINVAPTLPSIGTQTIGELNLLTITNTAVESNIHASTTGYDLVGGLPGMSISTNGTFTWTPAQNQSPGTNTVTVIATNNDPYDSVNPALSATNNFTVIVKEVNQAPTLPVVATQTVNELTLLTVTNTATEANIHASTTGYGIISPLAGMSISTNGIFTWTPSQNQSPGTNLVTVVVTNNDSFDTVNPVLTATNTFTVIVKEVNQSPVLPVIGTQTINELALLTVTNSATEPNIHAVTTGYTIVSPLAGMSINASGIFTWTPAQTQSPSTNLVTVIVTNNDTYDTVNPILTATNSFTVIVKEKNVAPELPVIGLQEVDELELLTVTNTAIEQNIHAETTGYSLLGALSGMSISTNGIFTWTPSQSQSPGTNIVTVVVTNNDPYDTVNPTLTSTSSFAVIVKEVNVAPVLSPVGTQTVNELTLLTVTNMVTEPNIHATTLGFGLISPLAGMSINASGIFTWTPSLNQGPSTNLVTVVITNSDVYDTVNPNLTATNSFTVIVKDVNQAPVLPVIGTQTVNELTLLTVTNTATEPNIHATTTGYTLVNAQSGMSINTNGIFTWTPSQSQSPGTNLVTVVVTNNDPDDTVNPALTATNSFTVIVKEVNQAPTLPAVATQTVNELTLLTVTNTAGEPNIHASTTGYGLISPLAGMNIDTNGIFTWTPSQNQSPGTNLVTVVVTNNDPYDTVNPALTATNSFTVVVKEVNQAPVLPTIVTQTTAVQSVLTVTNTATEPNIHATTVGYGLVNPPAGASISSNGIFTWTPQTPGTNTITTVVTNNDSFDLVNPVLTATNSFTVVATSVTTNNPPLSILSITQSNGVIIIAWSSVVGQNYAVQYRNNVTDANWLQLGPNILATNTVTSATDTNNNPQRFYRIEQLATVSNTPPLIQSISISGSNVILTWSAVAGDMYKAQYRTNIVGTWIDITPNVTAGGSTASITNAIGNSPQEFFRIVLLP